MRQTPLRALWALALGLAAAAQIAHAQTGGPYALTWSTLAGSGGTFSGAGAYRVGGTIGQPNAGPLAGGSYSLTGGFWNLGRASFVDVEGDRPGIPTVFRIYPNVPNPFSAQTTIALDLPSDQRVQMAVYNLKGERVRTLLDQVMPAGRHSMTWAGIGDDGRPLPSGVYWIRTQANDRSNVRKTVLVN